MFSGKYQVNILSEYLKIRSRRSCTKNFSRFLENNGNLELVPDSPLIEKHFSYNTVGGNWAVECQRITIYTINPSNFVSA